MQRTVQARHHQRGQLGQYRCPRHPSLVVGGTRAGQRWIGRGEAGLPEPGQHLAGGPLAQRPHEHRVVDVVVLCVQVGLGERERPDTGYDDLGIAGTEPGVL